MKTLLCLLVLALSSFAADVGDVVAVSVRNNTSKEHVFYVEADPSGVEMGTYTVSTGKSVAFGWVIGESEADRVNIYVDGEFWRSLNRQEGSFFLDYSSHAEELSDLKRLIGLLIGVQLSHLAKGAWSHK